MKFASSYTVAQKRIIKSQFVVGGVNKRAKSRPTKSIPGAVVTMESCQIVFKQYLVNSQDVHILGILYRYHFSHV